MTDALLLREQDRLEILRLLARHLPSAAAWAYGSRVNGGAHEGSDLDIVLRSPDLSPIPLEELRAFAQAVRDSNIPILVEARDWARLPESFQQEIMKNYVVMRETVSEWKSQRLKYLTVKIGSGATPRGGDNSYKNYGISLIRSQNILDFKFTTKGLAFIDESQAADLNNVEVFSGDVLLNITGDSVARCCIVDSNILPARVNQHVAIIRCDAKVADNNFIFYQLQKNKEELLSLSEIGATRRALTKGMIENLEILCPPISEQRVIASVLSSLDDKIDLLHRQNKTLEAMAEVLFRQWFVEEAGEDWEEGCLGDFAVNVTKSAKVSDIKSDDVYVGLEHIERRHISLVKTGSGDDVESNKYYFSKMDILFGKLRPYFHKVCFAPFNGICSTDILVIRPKKKHFFGYCLFAFFQDDVIEYANLGSGGTRMPRTNWEALSQYQVAVPDESKLIKFNEIAQSFVEKIEQNQKQIRTLEQLRDTLLPKLMSGEVRVAYAHEHIE